MPTTMKFVMTVSDQDAILIQGEKNHSDGSIETFEIWISADKDLGQAELFLAAIRLNLVTKIRELIDTLAGTADIIKE